MCSMKRQTAEWARTAEEGLEAATLLAARTPPPRNAVGFHCHQAAEQYLKALLQELDEPVPRTHDLEDLLDLLLPHDASLARLRRGLASLTRLFDAYSDIGERATTRRMQSALKTADRVRSEVRVRLGLPP